MNTEVDYLVQALDDANGEWVTVKKIRKPPFSPYIKRKKFLWLLSYQELQSGPYEEACLQKRKEAVDHAKGLTGKIRVVAFDEQFTQLGCMVYSKVVWKEGTWI